MRAQEEIRDPAHLVYIFEGIYKYIIRTLYGAREALKRQPVSRLMNFDESRIVT